MANGIELALANVQAFEAWKATQTDDTYRQIIYRGKLNRGEIAKAIDCGRSALTQNPTLRAGINQLEDQLRKEGILPPLTEEAKKVESNSKVYDPKASKRKRESGRLSALEKENVELKSLVKELKKQLRRYTELSETLSEMGFMPR
ncbi:VPA1267 family protein [Pseudoalteromonas sp. Ps84H-4]|uniref:VPA1267 family protein n=1 Tax=Pseudoalteromonas sp. Ps84H-4 TaxID=2954502 RepID=UPI0020978F20|nr:VPA1267 family protein [Pseudoalteromonas sp. Ps84H-4]MCO7248824.1 VPA1267 family protein [Pseudoalteromonas sp. Ps84H-4]